jgi:C-terminal processing protease CtpA/Prc
MRIVALALVLLGACAHANVYGTYYTDYLGGRSVIADHRLVAPDEAPTAYEGKNVDGDIQVMLERGYLQIGYSFFSDDHLTPTEQSNLVVELAKAKHAAVALYYATYTGTELAQIDRVVDDPTVKTWSTTDERGNTSSHQKTIDHYSTVTDNVENARYNYVATFWVRAKPDPLGARLAPLGQNRRVKLQRNAGVVVTAVVQGSPAFVAGVLHDDVLLALDHTPIVDVESFAASLASLGGREVELDGVRDDKPFQLRVALAAPGVAVARQK